MEGHDDAPASLLYKWYAGRLWVIHVPLLDLVACVEVCATFHRHQKNETKTGNRETSVAGP